VPKVTLAQTRSCFLEPTRSPDMRAWHPFSSLPPPARSLRHRHRQHPPLRSGQRPASICDRRQMMKVANGGFVEIRATVPRAGSGRTRQFQNECFFDPIGSYPLSGHRSEDKKIRSGRWGSGGGVYGCFSRVGPLSDMNAAHGRAASYVVFPDTLLFSARVHGVAHRCGRTRARQQSGQGRHDKVNTRAMLLTDAALGVAGFGVLLGAAWLLGLHLQSNQNRPAGIPEISPRG